MRENDIGREIVDAAIGVHRELGPGLLETVYETVLHHELTQRGLESARQAAIPIEYRGIRLPEGFKADILVEAKVIVELKSVEEISRVHFKQLHTYLRLSGLKLGYLLNFGALMMKDGITRVANGLEDGAPNGPAPANAPKTPRKAPEHPKIPPRRSLRS